MCQHQPPCPPADASDREAAHIVASHPEQGWSLLCNGVECSRTPARCFPMAGASRRTGRPGSVDTAMQAWIRAQPPAKIGAALHERFARSYEEGSLITPGQSARSLMQHLATGATGETWNVTPADLRSEAR